MVKQKIYPCTFLASCQQFFTSQWNCSQVVFLIPENVTMRWHQYSTFNKAGSCSLITQRRKRQDCSQTEKNELKQHIHHHFHDGDFQILLCPWQPSRLTWSPQQSVSSAHLPLNRHTHLSSCSSQNLCSRPFHQFLFPSLDLLQHLNVLPIMRGPELNTELEVWPH